MRVVWWQAKEKSSPPGVLSAIIHAWQALTVYHEPPMDWTVRTFTPHCDTRHDALDTSLTFIPV